MKDSFALDCKVCQHPLYISPIERRSHSHTCVCRACGMTYQVRFDAIEPVFVNAQKRFSHKTTTWHATYSFNTDSTRFVQVERRSKPQGEELLAPPPSRNEHALSGFILPERFINLLAFL